MRFMRGVINYCGSNRLKPGLHAVRSRGFSRQAQSIVASRIDSPLGPAAICGQDFSFVRKTRAGRWSKSYTWGSHPPDIVHPPTGVPPYPLASKQGGKVGYGRTPVGVWRDTAFFNTEKSVDAGRFHSSGYKRRWGGREVAFWLFDSGRVQAGHGKGVAFAIAPFEPGNLLAQVDHLANNGYGRGGLGEHTSSH